MIIEISTLVTLVQWLDRLPPAEAENAKRGRGRPCVYDNRLFIKALVISIVRQIRTVKALRDVLEEPTPEMRWLKAHFTDAQGRFPARRTWERRLKALPENLPAQIVLLGHFLLALIQPFASRQTARGAPVDSTMLKARGGVCHVKQQKAGIVPHTSIDTEAG
jgi:hypothetical protein